MLCLEQDHDVEYSVQRDSFSKLAALTWEWTEDDGQRTRDSGQRTADSGQWIVTSSTVVGFWRLETEDWKLEAVVPTGN